MEEVEERTLFLLVPARALGINSGDLLFYLAFDANDCLQLWLN
jgi:hypothetical protein